LLDFRQHCPSVAWIVLPHHRFHPCTGSQRGPGSQSGARRL